MSNREILPKLDVANPPEMLEAETTTANDFFRPGLQKTLIYDWFLRNQIKKIVANHEGARVITNTSVAPQLTRLAIHTNLMHINNAYLSDSDLTKIKFDFRSNINQYHAFSIKTILCLGLKLESSIICNLYPASTYFNKESIEKRLPSYARNSCFCDSVLAALLHCNLEFVFNILNEQDNEYSLDDIYWKAICKYFKFEKKTGDSYLDIVNGDDWISILDPEKKEYLPKTRESFRKFVKGKNLDPTEEMRTIRDASNILTSGKTNYRQEDASLFYDRFVKFGYFYQLSGFLFFSHIRVTIPRDSQEYVHEYQRPLYGPAIDISLPSISQDVLIFQELFNNKLNGRNHKEYFEYNNMKYIDTHEILYPVYFLAIGLHRWDNEGNKDTREIKFEEHLHYFVNGNQVVMEICAFIIHTGDRSGGHYTCYFKTDEGESSKWYYYDDLGKVLDSVKWKDMSNLSKSFNNEQNNIQNARLVFLRAIPRPWMSLSEIPKKKPDACKIILIKDDVDMKGDFKSLLDNYKDTYFRTSEIIFDFADNKQSPTDITKSDIVGYYFPAHSTRAVNYDEERYKYFKNNAKKIFFIGFFFRKIKGMTNHTPDEQKNLVFFRLL